MNNVERLIAVFSVAASLIQASGFLVSLHRMPTAYLMVTFLLYRTVCDL